MTTSKTGLYLYGHPVDQKISINKSEANDINKQWKTHPDRKKREKEKKEDRTDQVKSTKE